MYTETVRTTVEIKAEHRAKLLELAARKGEKGFSRLIAEALDAFLKAQSREDRKRQRALNLRGSMGAKDADDLRAATLKIRAAWR